MLRLLPPLLFLLSGWGVLATLGARRDRSWPIRLGWAYLAGTAWVGLALFVSSLIFRLPIRAPLVWLTMLLPPVIGAIRLYSHGVNPNGTNPDEANPDEANPDEANPDGARSCLYTMARRGLTLFARPRQAIVYKQDLAPRSPTPRSLPAPRSLRPPRSLLVFLPLFVAAPVFAALLMDAVGRPLGDWDGRAIWAAHARFMRDEGTVAPLAIREEAFLVEHPRYPPLMPLVQVAALESLGLPNDDRGFRPVYAFFLPALVLVTFDLASLFAGPLPAALAASFLPLLPQLTDPNGGASGAYSDLPFAAFWGGGFLLLRCRRKDVPFAALLLAAAATTKNEGAPLALLLAGVALISGRGRNQRLVRWIPATTIVAVLLLLLRFRSGIAARLDEGYASLLSQGGAFVRFGENVAVAIPETIRRLGDPGLWGSYWTLFLVAGLGGLGALRRRSMRRVSAVGAVACVIPLAAYGAVARDTVLWLVGSTASRFALQMIVPASILLAAFVSELFRREHFRFRSGRPSPALAVAAPKVIVFVIAIAIGVALFRSGPRLALLPEPLVCPCAPPAITGDDPTLPASIDSPAEGETVAGELVIKGWSQEEAGPSDVVTVWIDDEVRHCDSSVRVARPDVQAVLPRLGPADRAGYVVRYPFRSGDGGPHRLRVRFWSPTGRVRTLERRFVWRG